MGSNNRLITTEEFIAKAKVKFGDKFNYDEVVYVNSTVEVIITCNTCDTKFHQMPTCHMAKYGKGGCPVCSKLSRIASNKAWLAGANKKNEEAMNTEIPYKHWELHNMSKMNIN